MAYSANTNGKAIFKTNTKYPKRLSKRESRVVQTSIDTVVDEGIGGGAAYVSISGNTNLALSTFNYVELDAGALTLTFPAITDADVGKSITLSCTALPAGAVTLDFATLSSGNSTEYGAFKQLRLTSGGVGEAGPFAEEFYVVYTVVKDITDSGNLYWAAGTGFAKSSD